MLVVDHLTVAFRRYAGITERRLIRCLNDVSLAVGRGDLVALVGASGAGKSLLAHAIVGILPGNAEIGGEIMLDGVRLTVERQARIRGKQVALVPQSIAFLDPLARVAKQIKYAAHRAEIPRSRRNEVAATSLARFGLDPGIRRAFPHELSGGMARRVLLAIATIADPHLVIADEPTTGLDDLNTATVLDHLRAVADKDKGVLLITHDIRAAIRVADRVVVIRDGVTLEDAPAAAFSGTGNALSADYSRALWHALPENNFVP